MKEYFVRYATESGEVKDRYFAADSKEELIKLLLDMDLYHYVIAAYEHIWL